MKTRLFSLILLVAVLLPQPLLAQNDQWTCDDGPDDVLNAAQASYDAGDLEQAYELATLAEEICGSGNTANSGRYTQALALRLEIERVLLPAPTLTPESQVEQLLNQGYGLYSAGQYEEALKVFEEALEQARQIDYREGEGFALILIGHVYKSQFQYERSIESYQQSLVVWRELDDQGMIHVGLTNIGSIYQQQGPYDKALDYYHQALVIARELGDRERESFDLNIIGLMYWSTGQFDEALEAFEQSLTITRDLGDRELENAVLNNIGLVYDDQGQDLQAIEYYQESLEIKRELGQRVEEGITMHNIGSSYTDLGQLEEALEYLEQALVIRREVEDRIGEGNTLNAIARVRYIQGRYEEALDSYEQALIIHREMGNWIGEADTLFRIGTVYKFQGRYIEALEYFQQVLIVYREAGNPVAEGNVLDEIGNTYRRQEQYGLALNYHLQALSIHREIGYRSGEGSDLGNIGLVYFFQGRYQEALDYSQQSLVIARETGNLQGEGAVLTIIGNIYRDIEVQDEALDYYEQALVITREIGEKTEESNILNYIGVVYSNQEKYEEALSYYLQSLSLVRQLGYRIGEAETLLAIGVMYRLQGEDDNALEYLEQALIIAREIDNQSIANAIHLIMGWVYSSQGQYAEAISHILPGVEAIENVISGTALDTSIASTLEAFGGWHGHLAMLYAAEDDFNQTLHYTERARSVIFRDQLIQAPIDFRTNSDEALLQQENELRLTLLDAQNYLNSLKADLSASPEDINNAQKALESAHNAYEAHLELMQLQGGFLARDISFQTASLEEIQAALPPDTTLLMYGLNQWNNQLLVLMISTDGLDVFLGDVVGKQIDEQVSIFNSDRHTNTTALRELYDLIFAPIADKITTENLIVSPDGVLNYVPFAALQAPDGSYLIDHYTTSMIPSGTALVLLSEREPGTLASSPGLVLAQPSAPGLPNLRYAQSEAETVAEQLGVNPITAATESDLRNGSTGAAMIHISAHAELDRFAPMFSVIHLGEDDQHDGRFEVREIYELDLTQGTELVVLSGCETASGGSGEDFGLLSRAFFAAGAPRVVASLWSVDDAATADLLSAFYAARDDYDTDAAALRAAMLATREQYPEPYYWASFVLAGQP